MGEDYDEDEKNCDEEQDSHDDGNEGEELRLVVTVKMLAVLVIHQLMRRMVTFDSPSMTVMIWIYGIITDEMSDYKQRCSTLPSMLDCCCC